MIKKFYVTTPIYYPSGELHIGNAYSTILADTLKRYKKLQGYETFFLTGSDEHGEKIFKKAQQANMLPIDFLNIQVTKFVKLWKILGVDYDYFIRTTNPKHIETVQKTFSQLLNQKEIYKSKYHGYYCIECETFWPNAKAKFNNFSCGHCKRKLSINDEEAYFIKVQNEKKFIKNLLSTNNFLIPQRNINELITNVIEKHDSDLCVSRSSFNWGIPILEDSQKIVYVWIEALQNYISALGYLQDDASLFQKFWNNDTEIVHVVGKDIIVFHAIYWPLILKKLGILPKNITILGHGWITLEGKKMSKSFGNVVNPITLVKKYGLDHFRYYMLKEIKIDAESDFSYERFIEVYNSDLANKYGNLVSRTQVMIKKYCQGMIPQYQNVLSLQDQKLEKMIAQTIINYEKEMNNYLVYKAIWEVTKLLKFTNKYLDLAKPWNLAKNNQNQKQLYSVLNHVVKVIEIASFLFKPIIPQSANLVLKQFNISDSNWNNLTNYSKNNNLQVKNKINLFPRIKN